MMATGDVAHRLDSLAARSDGDYIHIEIGQCFGKCEATMSLYRDSPAHYYIYEAEGWRFNEQQREFLLYRLRRPVGSDDANAILDEASKVGISRLVDDSTRAVTDQPLFWLRARIADRTIVINGAYIGGEKYVKKMDGDGGQLTKVFYDVKAALFRLLNQL